MKRSRLVRVIALVLALLTLAACGGNGKSADKEEEYSAYSLDYFDAESFERDLNAGVKVKGKIVQFRVNAYKPKSALGINTWAGEHLNFISKNKLDVKKGDYVIGRIKSEPKETLFGGSWKISYEVLEIHHKPVTERNDARPGTENSIESTKETTPPKSTVPSETTPKNTTVKMPRNTGSYIGKALQETEEELKKLGFENVKKVETKTTDTSKTNGTVASITINSNAFSKGEIFDKSANVVITYWKVEKPASEYESAFVRKLGSYSLYFMFDEDNKTVVYFGTNDTYIEKGTYSGSFNTGVTIKWNHGEWTEKFINTNGSNKATLIDGNGYEWEYKVCSVSKAQEILDELK